MPGALLPAGDSKLQPGVGPRGHHGDNRLQPASGHQVLRGRRLVDKGVHSLELRWPRCLRRDRAVIGEWLTQQADGEWMVHYTTDRQMGERIALGSSACHSPCKHLPAWSPESSDYCACLHLSSRRRPHTAQCCQAWLLQPKAYLVAGNPIQPALVLRWLVLHLTSWPRACRPAKPKHRKPPCDRCPLTDRRQPLLATTPRKPQHFSTTPTSSGCAARLSLLSLAFDRGGQACGAMPGV